MSDIFISYAREDRKKIEALAKGFENQGWSVWWDRKIPPGKTFYQVIVEELAEARCVVVAWSKQSVKSNWVQEEADEGLKKGILIPVIIEDVLLPMGFRRIQAVDLIKWDPAEASQNFQFLIKNVAQILEQPPSTKTSAPQQTEMEPPLPDVSAKPLTSKKIGQFTNTSSMYLPIVGDQFLTQPLYMFVPLILISIYVFFHLYMQRNWESMGTLPAIFPDGTSLPKKLHRWFLNCFVRRNFRILKKHRSLTAKLEEGSAILIGWWAVPVTLMGFWVRYLPRRDWTGTALHIIFFLAALAAALGFYQLSVNNLNGTANRRFGFRSVWRVRKFRYGLILGTAGILMWVLSHGAINGIRSDQPDFNSLKSTVPWLFLKLGFDVFADIREVDVSSKPVDFFRIENEQDRINSVTGALLKKKDLRYADMFRAFLAKAILRRVNMEGARLRKVDFQAADMRQANLQRSDLTGANLKGADLREANLTNALLVGAQFQNANLGLAQFHGADLSEVDLHDADLRCAKLAGAKNLTAKKLGTVKTLYKADLDTILLNEIKNKVPHLLETPAEQWVELNARKRCP